MSYDFGVAKSDGICYNVKAFGYSNATIQKFSGFKENLLEIHYQVPKLSISGFYKSNINVFGFQMKNEGSININLCEFY